MIKKVDYTRRLTINEFNTLIEKVNEIIDKLNQKIEIEEVSISREVKDFKFFNWEEVKLPYVAQYTITSTDEASKVFEQYAFSYKELKSINDLIIQGKVVALTINVTEEITEKDKTRSCASSNRKRRLN